MFFSFLFNATSHLHLTLELKYIDIDYRCIYLVATNGVVMNRQINLTRCRTKLMAVWDLRDPHLIFVTLRTLACGPSTFPTLELMLYCFYRWWFWSSYCWWTASGQFACLIIFAYCLLPIAYCYSYYWWWCWTWYCQWRQAASLPVWDLLPAACQAASAKLQPC